MKKILVIAVIAVLSAISFISCKSHEKCPAYSQVEQGPETVR
jgi:hypothetical protein